MDERKDSATAGPEAAPVADVIEAEPVDVAEPVGKEGDTPADLPAARASVLPMLLSGAVVAALGFAGGYLLDVRNTGLVDRVDDLQSRLSATEAAVQDKPAPIDLAPIEQRINDLEAGLQSLSDTLAASTGDLAARLDRLGSLPEGDGTATDLAMAAIGADLSDLSGRIDVLVQQQIDLRAEMTAQIGAAQAAADTVRAQIAEENRLSRLRVALSELQAAFEAGGDLTDALTTLRDAGAAVPNILEANAATLPSLADLKDGFPDAARSALAAARSAGVSGETGGAVVSFLREQLDVRSVSVQAGDSVDAILSRAGASLSSGRLGEVLTNVDSLPEIAAAEMKDWADLVRLRGQAQAALDGLLSELAQN